MKKDKLKDELSEIAVALIQLGTNKSTAMGAIELLSLEIKQSSERISEALNNIADAIRSDQ